MIKKEIDSPYKQVKLVKLVKVFKLNFTNNETDRLLWNWVEWTSLGGTASKQENKIKILDTSLIELLEQGKKRFTQRGLDVTEEND